MQKADKLCLKLRSTLHGLNPLIKTTFTYQLRNKSFQSLSVLLHEYNLHRDRFR